MYITFKKSSCAIAAFFVAVVSASTAVTAQPAVNSGESNSATTSSDSDSGSETLERKVAREDESIRLQPLTVTAPQISPTGSFSVTTREEIEVLVPLSTIDVLQFTPGVHAVGEYGRGLRPNIGIRGLNPNRSRNVLITADGVPIQPAVYGDPAAYFNVPVEQIERIEVIKGNASVLHGPNTAGGVVNYVLRRPPEERELRFSETFREGGLFATTASYGDTLGQTGLLLNFSDKRGSVKRDNTNTDVQSISLRLVTPIADNGEADLRLSYHGEEAQTPGGLNVAQFKENPDFSQRSNDVFFGRRFAATLKLQLPLTKTLSLDTLTYLNSFERDWFIAGGVDGAATTNNQFLRDFVVAGVEPKLRWIPNDRINLVTGARVHFEEQEDIRRQGTSPDARNGTTSRESELQTLAISPFVSMDLKLADGLTITPGVRYEHVDQSREVGLRSGAGGTGGNKVTEEVLGGIGISYKPLDELEFFGNYSRNFQPPTFNEALDPTTGTSNDIQAETSDNFEIGFRSHFTDWFSVDTTGFWTNFENQIISEAGVLTNAGKTRQRGVEGGLNLGYALGLSGNLTATYVDTEFLNGPNKGNELPEAPSTRLSWAMAYAHPVGIGTARVRLDGTFVDERFTDAANTVTESADGGRGQLPSYHIWNLRFDYDMGEQRLGAWKFNAGINNLFDREYRLRRQAFFGGIIPGATRIFYAGFSAKF